MVLSDKKCDHKQALKNLKCFLHSENKCKSDKKKKLQFAVDRPAKARNIHRNITRIQIKQKIQKKLISYFEKNKLT